MVAVLVLSAILIAGESAFSADETRTAYKKFDISVDQYVRAQERLAIAEQRLESADSGEEAALRSEIRRRKKALALAELRALETAGRYLGDRGGEADGDIGSLSRSMLRAGEAALVSGRLSEALYCAQKSVALSPNDARGHVLHARILSAMGLHRSAVVAARKALTHDPASAGALKIVALAQMKAGEYRRAVDSVARALTGKSLFGTSGETWALPDEAEFAQAVEKGSPIPFVLGGILFAVFGFILSGIILRRRVKSPAKIASPKPVPAPASSYGAALDHSGEEYLGGKYELTDVLDYGSVSQLWAATDHVLKRKVMVRKVIEQSLPDPVKTKDAIKSLSRRIAELRSQYAIDFFEVIDDQGKGLFLVHENLTGTTAAKRLEDSGAFSPAEVLKVFRSVCEALDAAHAAGMIHGSLSPSNIQLLESGHVKILDFGMSRILREFSDTAYLPPEADQAGSPGPSRDIYSLGACLYALLTARSPEEAAQDAGLAANVKEIVEGSMHPEPSRRIRTVREFLAALELALSVRSSTT